MKLTKSHLRKLIKEELSKAIKKESARQEKTISIDWSTINLTDEEKRLLMDAFDEEGTPGQLARLLDPGRKLTREDVRVLMLSIEEVGELWRHEGLDSLYEAFLTAGEEAGWTGP